MIYCGSEEALMTTGIRSLKIIMIAVVIICVEYFIMSKFWPYTCKATGWLNGTRTKMHKRSGHYQMLVPAMRDMFDHQQHQSSNFWVITWAEVRVPCLIYRVALGTKEKSALPPKLKVWLRILYCSRPVKANYDKITLKHSVACVINLPEPLFILSTGKLAICPKTHREVPCQPVCS